MIKGNVIITSVAIVALTAIEVCAIMKNIDGTLMTIVVAAIAGLGGFQANKIRETIKKLKI